MRDEADGHAAQTGEALGLQNVDAVQDVTHAVFP
jgi:hypothetical protein